MIAPSCCTFTLCLHACLPAGFGSEVDANPYKVLEIDLGPFNRNFPRMNMASYIGQGVTFLNRHLSSSMFQVRRVAALQCQQLLFVHIDVSCMLRPLTCVQTCWWYVA